MHNAIRTLIERVDWIAEIAREFRGLERKSADLALQAVATNLEGFLSAMATMIEQA